MKIWGRYRNNKPELIESALRDIPKDAEAMVLEEYRIALSTCMGDIHKSDWKLWIGSIDDEPKEGGECS